MCRCAECSDDIYSGDLAYSLHLGVVCASCVRDSAMIVDSSLGLDEESIDEQMFD